MTDFLHPLNIELDITILQIPVALQAHAEPFCQESLSHALGFTYSTNVFVNANTINS